MKLEELKQLNDKLTKLLADSDSAGCLSWCEALHNTMQEMCHKWQQKYRVGDKVRTRFCIGENIATIVEFNAQKNNYKIAWKNGDEFTITDTDVIKKL